MQPVGIEPTSEALQAPAMTTSAKVALVPRTRIELVISGYQPLVIPFNYPGILAEVTGFEPVMTISKTVALDQTRRHPNKKLGIPPGTRTPTNGFGDRYAAITPARY